MELSFSQWEMSGGDVPHLQLAQKASHVIHMLTLSLHLPARDK